MDASAALTVSGGGVSATSNPFVLQAGPVASFQWSAIPGPQYTNFPFPVTVTAQDANGFAATSLSAFWAKTAFLKCESQTHI